jgi:hypothetical protein
VVRRYIFRCSIPKRSRFLVYFVPSNLFEELLSFIFRFIAIQFRHWSWCVPILVIIIVKPGSNR